LVKKKKPLQSDEFISFALSITNFGATLLGIQDSR